ncbi:uncharacterized protein METZ01_LOCUS443487, partial [marine metagenome]
MAEHLFELGYLSWIFLLKILLFQRVINQI